MTISFKSLGATPAKSERTAVITSTQSWTAPADCNAVDVFLVGGGGGASGHHTGYSYGGGGGGGGGQVLRTSVAVTPGSSYTVTIGAGGSAGYASSGTSASIDRNGYAGGTTSFGSLVSALGGGGAMYTTLGFWSRNPAGYNGGGEGSNNTSPCHSGGGGGAGAGAYNMSASLSASSSTSTSGWMPGSLGGTPGGRGTYSNYGWSWPMMGGRGIDGYGGGGSGGNNDANLIYPVVAIAGQIPAVDGGGYGFYNGGSGGGSGAANRGGGGGGSSSGNTNVGSGGSGIAIIKYWSAL